MTNQTCVARFQSNGQRDVGGFGSNGFVTLDLVAGNEQINAIAMQPDGKIVLAGFCNVSDLAFCVGRINPDGTPDLVGFGVGGLVVTTLGSGSASINAIALQSDGKIVAAGHCSGASNGDFCLTRYHSNGANDLSFGTGGWVITQIGTGGDTANAVAIQADGKIVAAGSCNGASFTDFCIARYQGGSFGARQCSMDIDGDGVVRADRDLLIATRVAFGMKGNDVMNAITFESHATRQSWESIRDYLANQCGMRVLP